MGRENDARSDSTSRSLTRRDLVMVGVAAAGGLLARRLSGQVGAMESGQPVGDLVIRNARALDAEAPLQALVQFQTAPEHFFVRSHFGPPAQLPLAWALTIDGLVQRPLSLSLEEIRRLGGQSRPVTLECAGNGRGNFRLPNTSGVQWEYGGVSTAMWTGVPLSALLERVGLTAQAQHFWMEALDHAPAGDVPKFLRSIPRDVALSDAFVAYEMNGKPIPLLHGGPLRLIVPGWFGMASTKWLARIHAMPVESDNYFMSHGYRYANGGAVTTMVTKSVIAAPVANQRVRAGMVEMRGQAWSGTAEIRSVDVSADGGRSWQPARLPASAQSGAWRSWEASVKLGAGPAVLMARATDTAGATQPMQAEPNPGGYGNNSIHQVPVHVG